MEPKDNKKAGYSKRPLWQWIVIYVIVGAVVYGAAYLVIHQMRASSGTPSTQNSSY